MSNYIKNIQLGSSGISKAKNTNIQFALPHENNNSITIICGKNRTGKSYLFRKIDNCIKIHNKNIEKGEKSKVSDGRIKYDDVSIEVEDMSSAIENFFLISNIDEFIRISKTISIEKNTKFKERGPKTDRSENVNNLILFKLCLDEFAKDFVSYQLRLKGSEFSESNWMNDDYNINYRKKIAEDFNASILYKLNPNDDLVAFFFKATSGQLYFSRNITFEGTHFDLYLVYSEKIIIKYQNWSEGQKVLFISLLIIKYLKIKIFLFDEIENHLHPEYISLILEFLKKHIPQSIISSHHPHIIFSEYVDKVWYLEISNNIDEFINEIKKPDRNQINIAPNRFAIELYKNYHKLSKVYDLFDNYDNKLLKLSLSSLSDLNDFLVEVFTNIFHYGIVTSKPNRKVDLQVEELLVHIFKKIENGKKLKILEIGAGKGRVMLDIDKLHDTNLSNNVQWDLYEPFEEVFHELKENMKSIKTIYDINIINELSDEKSYDIIFFANVLHELTPNILADYFTRIPKIIDKDGEVIIVEIFPLLLPERFSVPYKHNEIEDIFREIKWKVYTNFINIKNAKVNAYWTVLRKNNNTIVDESKIKNLIEVFWKKISDNRCRDYGGKFEFKSIDETIRIMSELTSIASINSYFCGEWELEKL